jgi:hypothetical protein
MNNNTMTDQTRDTKLSLLMKNLTEFYKEENYINVVKSIIDQENILSLRILDWFITNYSKKFRTIINSQDRLDVYTNYKLMLKSFSKRIFDPFSRKNKIIFYYTETDYIETSCGQLCFFKWCFENGILEYVRKNLEIIEKDMKESLKARETAIETDGQPKRRREPLSVAACRSISKQHIKYTLKFD